MTWGIFLQNFISALIGALFTLLGGYIQQKRSESIRHQEAKRQLKFKVLYDFNSNKNAIGQGVNDKGVFRAEFVRSLNSIPIAYFDSKKVIDAYDKFIRAINSGHDSSSNEKNELLYQLIVSMFEDLDLTPPSYQVYSTYLDIK